MKGLIVIFVGGVLFGLGLAVSGLVKPEVVLSFLHIDDLGLAITMAAALVLTLPAYQLAPRLRARPALGTAYARFPLRVSGRNLAGGALFGIGWGLGGICPGAAVASVGVGNWPILAGLAGMLIGAYVQGALMPRSQGPLATAAA